MTSKSTRGRACPSWKTSAQLPRSVEAVCGGLCSCATCHVLIDEQSLRRLPPRRYEERVMLATSRSFDPQRSRLSCQIKVTPDLDGLRLTVAPDEP